MIDFFFGEMLKKKSKNLNFFPLRKKISYLCHYFAASNNRKLFFEKYWAVAVVKSYFEFFTTSFHAVWRGYSLFAPVAPPFII